MVLIEELKMQSSRTNLSSRSLEEYMESIERTHNCKCMLYYINANIVLQNIGKNKTYLILLEEMKNITKYVCPM